MGHNVHWTLKLSSILPYPMYINFHTNIELERFSRHQLLIIREEDRIDLKGKNNVSEVITMREVEVTIFRVRQPPLSSALNRAKSELEGPQSTNS